MLLLARELIFLPNSCFIQEDGVDSIIVDDWIKFRANKRIAQLVKVWFVVTWFHCMMTSCWSYHNIKLATFKVATQTFESNIRQSPFSVGIIARY